MFLYLWCKITKSRAKSKRNALFSAIFTTFAHDTEEYKMKEIYTAAELMAYIQQLGFLPLLDGGVASFSADNVVADDCRYVVLPDGGWDWPL